MAAARSRGVASNDDIGGAGDGLGGLAENKTKEETSGGVPGGYAAPPKDAYGSAMEHDGVKMASRNTFLISPEGKIAKVYTGVKPADHSEQVLKDLAELKKS